MAAIDTYLQQILDAVYGEEVRGAIHDAIQQVYDDGRSGVPTSRKINGHDLTTDVTLTASDVGAVPTSRTVNGKALSSDVSLSASDVSALSNDRTITINGVSKNLSSNPSFTVEAEAGVPATRTINGHALSDDVTLTASDVGAVSLTGNSIMTGTLTSPEMRIKNDSYPSFYYQTTSGIIGRTMVNHNSRNMSFREMKSGAHFDAFTLPIPTITEETDNYYDIVTTKGSYTMNGTLTAQAINIYASSYPGIDFRESANGTNEGRIYFDRPTNRFVLAQFADNSEFSEAYVLPVPEVQSATKWYSILTTKDWLTPVSVTTGVSRVTVQYNNSFKFLGKLVVVNVRLSIATGTAIPVNSGVCNVQQAAYVPASPGDTGTYATIAAAPYGPFKISPNGTVTATVQIPADYSGTITMSGVFFAA